MATVALSESQASILLGATLMHWGVPFHHMAKRELEPADQDLVDQASEKLIDMRSAHRVQVELSDREGRLLIEVTNECLKEIGGNDTDLRLHLKAQSEQEVLAVVKHLEQIVGGEAKRTDSVNT